MIKDKNYYVGQKIFKIDDCYWIVSNTLNVIWKCDLLFNVLDYVILENESAETDLFRTAVYVNGNLYLFPFNGNDAYRINVETKDIQKIVIDYGDYEVKNGKFSYAFVVNNIIIAVGRQIHGFLKYDLETGQSLLVSDGLKENDEYICSFTHGINGNIAYTVSVIDAKVIGFDLKKNTIKTYDMSRYCNKNLCTIMTNEEYIYITNDKCELLKFNDRLQLIECKKIEGWNDNNIRFSALKDDRCIYIGNTWGKILIETSLNRYIVHTSAQIDSDYGYCFTAVELCEDGLLLQSRHTGNIILVNFFDEFCVEQKVSANEKMMDEVFDELIKGISCHGGIIKEDTDMNLERFIGCNFKGI